MMQTLREPGQFTLFIPTNDAFLSIPDALRQRILDGDGCVSSKYIIVRYPLFIMYNKPACMSHMIEISFCRAYIAECSNGTNTLS